MHGQVPPGVPTMQKMKDEIRYQFRKSPQGGKLRISSSKPAAVEAIHQFLKFQIQSHQTGDPMTLQ
jgi:TusA-related sulfurtransferase